MRVASKVPVLGADRPVDTMPTATLVAVGNPFTMSELLHRVAQPITCLVLTLLAIPLAFVNPRAGSSTNLVLAMLIFFTYNNLMRMLEASLKQSKLTFALAWWPLPLFTLLCVVALFVWRVNPNNRFHPRVLWSHLKQARAPKAKAAA
jgi:lipopolysaccharide export system permease protein